ncbi:MAG: DUF4417 domain-containing protein [Gammaproteobacteria bacterium]
MSKSNKKHPPEKYGFSVSSSLWHDGTALTSCLGCQQCFYQESCGGLNVGAGIYDCLAFCRCEDPARCDNVCPRNAPHQVARIHEIGGLELDRVPPAACIAVRSLPHVVPMFYHSGTRARAPASEVVALSLYEFINKADGSLKFDSRREMLEHFQLADTTRIILSGTDHDPAIERWWRLENPEQVTQVLAQLGIELITSPNYSLFGDVPRLDNLFNMKRIAVVWSEIQRTGMACALHLNARTERDYDRWTEFLLQHAEITHVAFEFGTGAGFKNRIGWHVSQLESLAAKVARPLHLLVRGGINELPALGAAFARVMLIDTQIFMKTQHRQRALVMPSQLNWESAPTPEGAPLDELFDFNIRAVEEYVSRILASAPVQSRLSEIPKSA